MKNFKGKSSYGKEKGPKKNFSKFGKPRPGGFSKFKGKDSRSEKFQSDDQLHEATCDSCGKTCGVPFKPNGKKPVYCSMCFKKGNGSESYSKYGKDTFQKASSHSEVTKKDVQELNRKLDTILKLLQKK